MDSPLATMVLDDNNEGAVAAMNVPNQLTIARLGLTCGFLVFFFTPIRFGNTLALALFVAASITDIFDGKIARRDNLITNFGVLMDPLVDKILICSAFIAFVGDGLMPAWMVILIVARELAITGLRLLAASQNVVLAADTSGKNKTASQITAIITILVLVSYPEWGAWAIALFEYPLISGPWIQGIAVLVQWVAVFFTVLSGALYLWYNRAIYLRDL
jgi:CDP-diacylglycerol---glycerol-3-phosphate 3-phosphatidyltransferase